MPETTRITIEFDQHALPGYADSYLAALWHLAQVNPVPHGDKAAGELVERIGREIIRRWLRGVGPELWHHQGKDHYWAELTGLAKYEPGPGAVDSPGWHDGRWVPKAASPGTATLVAPKITTRQLPNGSYAVDANGVDLGTVGEDLGGRWIAEPSSAIPGARVSGGHATRKHAIDELYNAHLAASAEPKEGEPCVIRT